MEQFTIGSKVCLLHKCNAQKYLLLQPFGAHEKQGIAFEVHALQQEKNNFSFCAFEIENWNEELSPWNAPSPFGDVPLGNKAEDTLHFLLNTLIPDLKKKINLENTMILLGGYSLAGLFCLWSAYQTNMFDGVAGVSPSVWLEGWGEYISKREIKAKKVYLSLGSREHKTKNPILKTVKENLLFQQERLETQSVQTILEWNAGNHFQDPERRMTKGFLELISQ